VRRQNLVRKELAWLRRGPPARTSKPKFRIDAANALIADEPRRRGPARAAALRHPAARQGRLDVEDVDLARGDRRCCSPRDLAARAGRPVGIVGVNGSGKTSVLRCSGELAPSAGRVRKSGAPCGRRT
jgi:ATP-binding cassette subfamily F protein uup